SDLRRRVARKVLPPRAGALATGPGGPLRDRRHASAAELARGPRSAGHGATRCAPSAFRPGSVTARLVDRGFGGDTPLTPPAPSSSPREMRRGVAASVMALAVLTLARTALAVDEPRPGRAGAFVESWRKGIPHSAALDMPSTLKVDPQIRQVSLK